ncbi:MAG: molybdate ABC transporter permease subunit [Thermoleophilia bacterium]
MAFSLRLSFQVATLAALLTLLLGTALAYLLATRNFRGKELLDMVLTLPMVLPPVVTGYFLVLLVGRNGVVGRAVHALTGADFSIMFTWYAAVLAAFVVSLPLMIKTARAAFESVDPNLINASYTLGRTEIETIWRVVLPLARKGIVAGLTLAFARGLGEFGATLMVAGNIPGKTNTMPLEIYNRVVYGAWAQAAWPVAFFTVVSGLFIYLANRLNKRSFL